MEENMKKRFVTLLMAVLMGTIGLAGCGNADKTTAPSTQTQQSEENYQNYPVPSHFYFLLNYQLRLSS